jgi:hypothetical protein
MSEFSELASAKEERIFYTINDKCYNLQTGEEDEKYSSSQQEADTRIFFHLSELEKQNCKLNVTIDAEDTDVIILAAHIAHHCTCNLFLYRRGRVYDCNKLCSAEVAEVIVPLHAYTGADAVSGFYGHGKKSIYEQVTKRQEGMELISKLGEHYTVTTQVCENLIEFTIKTIYSDTKSTTLGQARATKWRQMKHKCTSRLPPDEDSLRHHIKRANYQTAVWNNYKNPDTPPSPLNHGWTSRSGILLPIMSSAPAIPTNIASLLLVSQRSSTSIADESESSSEDESNSESQ